MQPDMSFVRRVLLGFEKDGALVGRYPPAASEYCLLLMESGLINMGTEPPPDQRASGIITWRHAQLTARGSAALAILRDDENLQIVQQHADALGAHATFAHLKAFLGTVADWGTPPPTDQGEPQAP